ERRERAKYVERACSFAGCVSFILATRLQMARYGTRVVIFTSPARRRLNFHWEERGRLRVAAPNRKDFGSAALEQVMAVPPIPQSTRSADTQCGRGQRPAKCSRATRRLLVRHRCGTAP